MACPLTLLLEISDDSTTNMSGSLHGDACDSWDDVSLEELEHLLVAVDSPSPQNKLAPTSPTTSDSSNNRPTPSQQYRQRKRQEVAQLRSEVDQLHCRLEELQATRTRSEAVEQDAVVLAWKRIAAHQKAARRHAEQENARLKASLERELKVAQKLDKLLRKRACEELYSSRQGAKRVCHRTPPLHTDIFHLLHQQIRRRAFAIDDLLQYVGFASSQVDLESTRVCRQLETSVEWEILFAKTFPFSHTSTANAIWECSGSTNELRTLLNTDDQLEMLFRLPVCVRHCEVLIEAHVVMRRLRENTRTVQWYEGAWVLRSTNKTYDGITLRDQGWHVIQSLTRKPSSIVQCYSQLRLDTPHVDHPHEVNVIRETVFEVYFQHLQHAFQIFETVLVEKLLVPTVNVAASV